MFTPLFPTAATAIMIQALRMGLPKLGIGSIWPLLLIFSTSQILADQFDHLTSRVSGTRQDLRAVAFGEGRFVALGAGGTILTSTNSADWSIRSSGIAVANRTRNHPGNILVGAETVRVDATSYKFQAAMV